MKWLIYFLMVLLVSCASQETRITEIPAGLDLIEVNPDKGTAFIRQNIIHLAQVFDLSPVLFSKKIQIKTGKADHGAGEFVRVNTIYANEPYKVLAQLLHGEFHQWAKLNEAKLSEATQVLKRNYPNANKETLHHLFIVYLEYAVLTHYLGEKESLKIMNDFIRGDKAHSFLYSEVLVKKRIFRSILVNKKLLPRPLV